MEKIPKDSSIKKCLKKERISRRLSRILKKLCRRLSSNNFYKSYLESYRLVKNDVVSIFKLKFQISKDINRNKQTIIFSTSKFYFITKKFNKPFTNNE